MTAGGVGLGRVLLVEVDADVAVRLREAGGPDQDGSFEALARSADLPARLRRYNGTLDALVIGSDLDEAIDLASRAHARDPDLSVLIPTASWDRSRRPTWRFFHCRTGAS